jgi:hypothetical protein
MYLSSDQVMKTAACKQVSSPLDAYVTNLSLRQMMLDVKIRRTL